MKIPGNAGNHPARRVAGVYGIQQARPVPSGRAGSGAAPADRVELSPEAKRLKALLGEAQATPAVRAELVARLRREVQSGTYSVPAGELAQRLLDLGLAGDDGEAG